MTALGMSTASRSFVHRLDDLPQVLPVFPLPGVLLLPGGRLPLNVFEPRYVNMVRDALAGSRLIGMIQPVLGDDGEEPRELVEDAVMDEGLPGAEIAASGEDPGAAPLYRTGCAGRIVSFSETDDGRYLITLRGVVRFAVAQELDPVDGYRRVRAGYAPYADDLMQQHALFDRDRLVAALGEYFDQHGIEADWDAIREASNERLVTSLAMVCPFSSAEKQALLEAPDASQRAETMTTILEMAAFGPAGRGAAASRH